MPYARLPYFTACAVRKIYALFRPAGYTRGGLQRNVFPLPIIYRYVLQQPIFVPDSDRRVEARDSEREHASIP